MRKFARLLAATIAAMLAVPKYVLESGKWVLKSLFAPPVPEGAEIEDAMDAVAARAAAPVTPSRESRDTVTPTPAPAPKPEAAPKAAATAQVVELDPVLAKGKAAYDFACALTTLDGEPPTEGLNEAEIAWLNSLNTHEMMHVWRGGPMKAGAHMMGIKPIVGLPLCPTLAEYKHILGSAAQITPRQREEIAEYNETLDAAFDEMINSPTFELKHGI